MLVNGPRCLNNVELLINDWMTKVNLYQIFPKIVSLMRHNGGVRVKMYVALLK